MVVGLEESRTQFLTVSGVDLAESNNQFHYRLVVFFSHLKSKSGIFSSRRKKLEEITDSHTRWSGGRSCPGEGKWRQ